MEEYTLHNLGIATVELDIVSMMSVVVGAVRMTMGAAVGMAAAASVRMAMPVLEGVDAH